MKKDRYKYDILDVFLKLSGIFLICLLLLIPIHLYVHVSINEEYKMDIVKEQMVDIKEYRYSGFTIEHIDDSGEYDLVLNKNNKDMLISMENIRNNNDNIKDNEANIKEISDDYNLKLLENSILILKDNDIEKVYSGVNLYHNGNISEIKGVYSKTGEDVTYSDLDYKDRYSSKEELAVRILDYAPYVFVILFVGSFLLAIIIPKPDDEDKNKRWRFLERR